MSNTFILYSRQDCHLCEDMLEQLQGYIRDYQLKLKIIDVDSSAQFQQQYGSLVPLLCHQNGDDIREVCKYYLEPENLLSFLK